MINYEKNFSQIYKDHYLKILNFLKSKTSKNEDAEDLTSAVFEKAYKGLGNFKWQGLPISSWLFKIARNTLIDFYRTQKKNAPIESIVHTKPINSQLDQEVISDIYFEQILKTLDPKERKIIYMKFFEGHTNKSIAEKTNLSETNVGTIIHRVIKKLRV